ncbi:tudor domain-containing protein 7B-like isoform X2 [Lytechinus variegatus]|uniref:tudor domain-containing protein 7B-like isoform X2 n=1 Tax=Lytechinus variegatus TaxID=7654 RepID=UPI001BB2CD4C|nr:tudor domain-containing protein 7B-like isoform X2 [Lytechinus variegatus]
MSDKKSEKESFIEKVLRSVLISSKGGVPLQKLNHEFKDLLGQDIPYRENGFKNLEAYLRTMPTVCQIKRDPSTGNTVCMGVANEETKHVDRLVKKQKATKKKSKPARLPKYSGRSGNRSYRPPPRPKPGFHSQQQYPPKKFTNYPSGRNAPGSSSGPYQGNTGPHSGTCTYQRNDIANAKNDRPRSGPHQRTQRSGGGGEGWNSNPQNSGNRSFANSQRHNQGQKTHHYQHQHSSSYELPPRFRRQIHSTGSAGEDSPEPSSHEERSRSDSDYPVMEESNNNQHDREELPKEPPQQPHQPPPVDDKIVSWVSETLAEKTGGLWLSGLKKLYKEEFQSTMEDDLIHKLSRLSLWTAEEIGYGSVVGNDQILYPNLKVEISQSPLSGKERRNVTSLNSNRPPTVPGIVIPEEDCLWEVYVSYIISVVDFYCVIMGDEYADKLCTLEDDMREFYEADDPNFRLSNSPTVDSLYAAQMDDGWLRVKVVAIDNQEAGCFLVDHGDVESVPFDDLRVLDPSFYQLAFQAIPCKLHGMDNKATSKTATTRFCNVALGQIRLAQVISKESKRLSLTLYRDRLNINYLCALGEVA